MGFDRTRLPDPKSYFEDRGFNFKERGGKWRTTRCDFHGGSDSMRVNVERGCWVCMACPARGGDVLAFEMASSGLGFTEAAKALGCWVEDGTNMPKPRATKLSGADALSAVYAEALLCVVIAADLARGKPIDGPTVERLTHAAAAIGHLAGAFQ